MLAGADAVIESIQRALSRVPDDVVWLQMSTIGEEATQECLDLARERGAAFIDAPVLGTKQPAEQAKLVVLASGPDDVRDRVQPIFDAVGQKTMWLGDAGAGTRLKIVANSWVLTVTEGTAETVALAQGAGRGSNAAVRSGRGRDARSPLPEDQGQGDPRGQLRATVPLGAELPRTPV